MSLKSRPAQDYPSCAGSRYHVVRAPKVSLDGTISLVETGQEDIFEMIQSHAESTDLQTIMKKVQAGQLELLKQRPGSYGDFTKMPKTYAEVLQLQIDASRIFDGLPPEVRRKFDNSRDIFLAKAGTEEWVEAMRPVIPEEVFKTIAPKAAAAAAAADAAAYEAQFKKEQPVKNEQPDGVS